MISSNVRSWDSERFEKSLPAKTVFKLLLSFKAFDSNDRAAFIEEYGSGNGELSTSNLHDSAEQVTGIKIKLFIRFDRRI